MNLKKVDKTKTKLIDIRSSEIKKDDYNSLFILIDDDNKIVDSVSAYNHNPLGSLNLELNSFCGHPIELYNENDPKRFDIIDMLLPYAEGHKNIFSIILNAIDRRLNEKNVIIPLLKNECFKQAIERWKIIPNFLVNLIKIEKEWIEEIPTSFIRLIFNITCEKSFMDGIAGIIFLNGILDKRYIWSVDRPSVKKIIYEKLKSEMILTQIHSNSSDTVLNLLKETGNTFDFNEITFNRADEIKIVKNFKERIYRGSAISKWESLVKSMSYNDQYISILINNILPKITISGNLYATQVEYNSIISVINYLYKLGRTNNDEVIQILKSYILVPKFLDVGYDDTRAVTIINLIPTNEFYKYINIILQFKIVRCNITCMDEGRNMIYLIHQIYDKTKCKKIVQMILEKIDDSNIRTSYKNSLRSEVNTAIIWHNNRYPDQTFEVKIPYEEV